MERGDREKKSVEEKLTRMQQVPQPPDRPDPAAPHHTTPPQDSS